MLSKIALICLLVGQGFSDLGQEYNNNRGNQGLGQGYGNQGLGQGYNNNQGGLGQGYNNNQGSQGTRNGGLGQGSSYNGDLNRTPGIGQGDLNTNNGYSGSGYSGLGQSPSSQSGYSGVGRSNPQSQSSQGTQGTGYYNQPSQSSSQNQRNSYDSDDNAGLNPVPLNQGTGYYGRQTRSLGQETQPITLGQQPAQAKPLGQEQPLAGGVDQARQQSTVEALGQSHQSLSGQLVQARQQSTVEALGQSEQTLSSRLGQNKQTESLTPSLNQKPGLDGGQLRGKRYAEREPYRKTCNTYYGKYICYRLYEKDSSIPNDFTCWSTYLGKQNCTETENVLYLDRRNVEVDPSELDRQFTPSDRSSDRSSDRTSDLSSDRSSDRSSDSVRQRGQDDEFGAVEKNMHNRRNNERQLPSDEVSRDRYERPTQSSGARRLDSHAHDNRELRRGN